MKLGKIAVELGTPLVGVTVLRLTLTLGAEYCPKRVVLAPSSFFNSSRIFLKSK